MGWEHPCRLLHCTYASCSSESQSQTCIKTQRTTTNILVCWIWIEQKHLHLENDEQHPCMLDLDREKHLRVSFFIMFFRWQTTWIMHGWTKPSVLFFVRQFLLPNNSEWNPNLKSWINITNISTPFVLNKYHRSCIYILYLLFSDFAKINITQQKVVVDLYRQTKRRHKIKAHQGNKLGTHRINASTVIISYYCVQYDHTVSSAWDML
jgi:hypothetical protein